MSLYSYEFEIWPDWFVGHVFLLVFARYWPAVTDMQHYYHARYPTDDWHLAYVFSLAYFSAEVCLEGVSPHSVSTRWDPCVMVCAPLTLASPSRENIIEQRVTRLSTWAKRGTFELTKGSACIIGLSDSLISPYIAQFFGCVIGWIHYGLKVVFCFRHFTASHYHHYARLLTGIEHM